MLRKSLFPTVGLFSLGAATYYEGKDRPSTSVNKNEDVFFTATGGQVRRAKPDFMKETEAHNTLQVRK